jgi:WD40 repeat protein
MGLTGDGKRLVVVEGGAIRTYDASTLDLFSTVPLPEEYKQGFLIDTARNGTVQVTARVLQVGADGISKRTQLSVWDLATGRLRQQFTVEGCGQGILTPDGRTLVAIDENDKAWPISWKLALPSTVRAWDLETGRSWVLSRQLAHGFAGRAISDDGARMLLEIARATCVDVKRGVILWTSERVSPPATFTPDGKVVIALNRLDGVQPHHWLALDAATGSPRTDLKLPPSLAERPDSSPTVTPDGRTLLLPEPGRVRLWDMKEGKQVGVWRLWPTRDIGIGPFTPDGKRVFVTDGAIHCFNLATGERLSPNPYNFGHVETVTGVLFTPDGKSLISSGFDRTVRVWDLRTGKEQRRTLRKGMISDPRLGPNGRTVWWSHSSGAVVGWAYETGRPAGEVKVRLGEPRPQFIDDRFPPTPGLIAFTPDGVLVHFDRRSQDLTGWNPGSHAELWRETLGPQPGYPGIVGWEWLSPDGRFLLPQKWEHLLDARTARVRAQLEIRSEEAVWLWPKTVSADGRLLAGCLAPTGATGQVPGFLSEASPQQGPAALVVWESATGRCIARREKPGPVYHMRFAPGNRTLVVVAEEGLVAWDLSSRKWILAHRKPLNDHCWGKGGDLAVSSDGRHTAVARSDGTILLWPLTPPVAQERRHSPEEMQRLWQMLAQPLGYQAVWDLSEHAALALRLLSESVKPQTGSGAAQVRRLITDLDAEEFADREKATRRLKSLGPVAEPVLRQVRAESASPEVVRRAAAILEAWETEPIPPLTGEELRLVRAVAVLEPIRDPQAREVLKRIAEQGTGPAAEAARDALARRR